MYAKLVKPAATHLYLQGEAGGAVGVYLTFITR